MKLFFSTFLCFFLAACSSLQSSPQVIFTLTPTLELAQPTSTAPGVNDSSSNTPTIAQPPTPFPSASATPDVTRIATSTVLPKAIGPWFWVTEVKAEVQSLQIGADGAVWVIGNPVMRLRQDYVWENYLPEIEPGLVGLDSFDRVWKLNIDGSQISAWDGTGWSNFDSAAGWTPLGEGVYIHSEIETDGNGRIWLSTNSDVRVFDGEEWVIFSPTDMGMTSIELPEDGAVEGDYSIDFTITYQQTLDQVWIGSASWSGGVPIGGGGLRLFDGKSWLNPNPYIAAWAVTLISDDYTDAVWIGRGYGLDQNDGLRRYEVKTAKWYKIPLPDSPDGVVGTFTKQMTIGTNGEPWLNIGLCYAGFGCSSDNIWYHYENETWIQIGDLDTSGFDSFLLFAASRDPWLLRGDGIFRIKNNKAELAAELSVVNAVVDHSGQIWALVLFQNKLALWKLSKD